MHQIIHEANLLQAIMPHLLGALSLCRAAHAWWLISLVHLVLYFGNCRLLDYQLNRKYLICAQKLIASTELKEMTEITKWKQLLSSSDGWDWLGLDLWWLWLSKLFGCNEEFYSFQQLKQHWLLLQLYVGLANEFLHQKRRTFLSCVKTLFTRQISLSSITIYFNRPTYE